MGVYAIHYSISKVGDGLECHVIFGVRLWFRLVISKVEFMFNPRLSTFFILHLIYRDGYRD